MKAFLFAIVLAASVLFSPTINAGVSCYWIGKSYYCDDTDGSHTRCYRIGNHTYCD